MAVKIETRLVTFCCKSCDLSNDIKLVSYVILLSSYFKKYEVKKELIHVEYKQGVYVQKSFMNHDLAIQIVLLSHEAFLYVYTLIKSYHIFAYLFSLFDKIQLKNQNTNCYDLCKNFQYKKMLFVLYIRQ